MFARNHQQAAATIGGCWRTRINAVEMAHNLAGEVCKFSVLEHIEAATSDPKTTDLDLVIIEEEEEREGGGRGEEVLIESRTEKNEEHEQFCREETTRTSLPSSGASNCGGASGSGGGGGGNNLKEASKTTTTTTTRETKTTTKTTRRLSPSLPVPTATSSGPTSRLAESKMINIDLLEDNYNENEDDDVITVKYLPIRMATTKEDDHDDEGRLLHDREDGDKERLRRRVLPGAGGTFSADREVSSSSRLAFRSRASERH